MRLQTGNMRLLAIVTDPKSVALLACSRRAHRGADANACAWSAVLAERVLRRGALGDEAAE